MDILLICIVIGSVIAALSGSKTLRQTPEEAMWDMINKTEVELKYGKSTSPKRV